VHLVGFYYKKEAVFLLHIVYMPSCFGQRHLYLCVLLRSICSWKWTKFTWKRSYEANGRFRRNTFARPSCFYSQSSQVFKIIGSINAAIRHFAVYW